MELCIGSQKTPWLLMNKMLILRDDITTSSSVLEKNRINIFRTWLYGELDAYEIDLQKKILCTINKNGFVVMTIDAVAESICSFDEKVKEAVFMKLQMFDFAEEVEEFLIYTAKLIAKGQL